MDRLPISGWVPAEVADRLSDPVRRYDDLDHRAEAAEALEDPEKLKRVLNDTELAYPLASMFSDLDKSLEEMIGKNMPYTGAILTKIYTLRKQTLEWLLED